MLDRETILMVARAWYPVSEDANVLGWVQEKARDGYLGKDGFLAIVHWKAARVIRQAERNCCTEVRRLTEDAFRLARCGKAKDAVQTLIWNGTTGLHGVQTRMASAILTVHDPESYTVMDVRARRSLRNRKLCDIGPGAEERFERFTPETYDAYLGTCRKLADAQEVPLRELDRCLFTLAGRTVAEMIEAERAVRPRARCRERKCGAANAPEPCAE
jgi:hypothetical protein